MVTFLSRVRDPLQKLEDDILFSLGQRYYNPIIVAGDQFIIVFLLEIFFGIKILDGSITIFN